MSEKWNDVYFRATKDDTGNIPTDGCMSSCFDIITRKAPYDDPKILLTDSNWNTNASQDLNARMENYIYVRGTNLADKTQEGDVYLYYTRANLLLYPNLWQDNMLKVGGNKDCFHFSVEKNKKIVFADNQQGCFNWKPEMITGDHYCLISRTVTADHPADIPKTSDVTNFGKFIASNRSYGWRNVTVKDRDSADFSQTVHYKQGTQRHTMHILLSCKDVPVGAEVAISCPNTGPQPQIYMERTKITTPNQDLGIVCDVPAEFEGDITYYYWSNGKTPGDDFEIKLHAVVFVANNHPLYQYSKHYERLGFKLPSRLRQQLKVGGGSIGPEKGLILGQYATQIERK